MISCTECGYPPRDSEACDNPACLANPTLSEAHKAKLRASAEAYAARKREDEERLEKRRRLRAAGSTTAF